MKKKLIITESQYIKLQELLFETADVNDTLDYVKSGDILIFKGAYNIKITVINVDQNTSEILGTTNKGEKVKFFFNSYDEITNKFNFQILNKTSNKYVNQPFNVKELDIIRNGKIWKKEKTNVDNLGNTTDTSKEYYPYLDLPDDGSTSTNSKETTPIEKEPYKKEYHDFEEIPNEENPDKNDFDEMTNNIKNEIRNDDIFKDALFKQQSFWERLKGEITGEKPKGNGIIIANQLVNSWKEKTSNDTLKAVFSENNKAKFTPLVSYPSIGLTKDEFKDTIYYAMVREVDDNNYRRLEDVNKKYSLLVKKNISINNGIKDSFLCEFRQHIKTKNGGTIINDPVEIQIQFLPSLGYPTANKTK